MRQYRTARPPTGLMVNLLRWPDVSDPLTDAIRFSWQMNDVAVDQHQLAYQILVVPDPLPIDWSSVVVWDSGEWDGCSHWVSQASSSHIPYGGPPLEPAHGYWWKVRTWNARGEASPWSEPQRFRVGEESVPLFSARQQLVETSESPVSVVQVDSATTFIDFGRAAFGTVELTFDSPEPGEVLVRLGEVRSGPFAIDRQPGGARRFREFRLPVAAGFGVYRVAITPDSRNTSAERDGRKSAAVLMPPERGEVLPFRYCEIEDAPCPVMREHVRRKSVWYPFDEGASWFRCSDSVLNDVWDLCKYSMKATSFCGVHVDGDRERIPYEADAYINQLGYVCCDREYALSRYTHEYLITHPTWPTEWVLFSVLLAWEDYVYTGDISSASRFYGDLAAKTLSALARGDGLISTESGTIPAEVLAGVHFHPEWTMRDIVDWPEGERDGYDMRPINTVVNAFHYRALVLMSRLAGALGREEDARGYVVRSEAVRGAMHRLLIDESTGLFVDGEGSHHSSLHANMFPLAFGLVPAEHVSRVVAFIRGRGLCCSVYAAQFLLESLYRAGAGDAGLALMTSRSERSWAHWVYDVDSTIALEAWDDRFKPNQDWNHAWGAAPANIIPRFLVGVRPLTPGFERILIDPQPGSLSFVESRVPTIRGPVSVTIRQVVGVSIELTVSIPANSTARVVLRGWGRSAKEVLVDGMPCPGFRQEADVLIDPVGSGRHTVICLT